MSDPAAAPLVPQPDPPVTMTPFIVTMVIVFILIVLLIIVAVIALVRANSDRKKFKRLEHRVSSPVYQQRYDTGTTQTVTTTATALTYATLIAENDTSYNASTGATTVNQSGTYALSTGFVAGGDGHVTTGQPITIYALITSTTGNVIQVTGVTQSFNVGNTTGGTQYVSLATEVNLNATDQVQFFTQVPSGNAVSVNGGATINGLPAPLQMSIARINKLVPTTLSDSSNQSVNGVNSAPSNGVNHGPLNANAAAALVTGTDLSNQVTLAPAGAAVLSASDATGADAANDATTAAATADASGTATSAGVGASASSK